VSGPMLTYWFDPTARAAKGRAALGATATSQAVFLKKNYIVKNKITSFIPPPSHNHVTGNINQVLSM